MNLQDYLIEQEGKNWPALLGGWFGLLGQDFTLWMVNRFGDLIVVFEGGSVQMLDVGAGRLTRLAESREQFIERVGDDENANNWFMIPLVDECVVAGMTLAPNQCYGYKVPPMLGGKYDVDNAVTISLSEHYSFLADMYVQTKDLPDGTKVKAVVK